MRRFDGHSEAVWTMAVLPNERYALSGSMDKTLRLWDLAAGSELRRFEGHDSWINAIAVLADGRRALSGSYDQTLRRGTFTPALSYDCLTGMKARSMSLRCCRTDGMPCPVRPTAHCVSGILTQAPS